MTAATVSDVNKIHIGRGIRDNQTVPGGVGVVCFDNYFTI